MKRQLRIGKPCGFIAVLVLLAVSGVNAQKIVVGTVQSVYGDHNASGAFFHSIATQSPYPDATGGFFIDCPFITLRNTNGMDVYATNYAGIDIFRNTTVLNPLSTTTPINVPDVGVYRITQNCTSGSITQDINGDRVWEYRQDISNNTMNPLTQYRVTDILWLRKDPTFYRNGSGLPWDACIHPTGSVTFAHPYGHTLANPRSEESLPELLPPNQPIPPEFNYGWDCESAWIPHVYKIEPRDIPNPNPYGIAAGDLIGFVHVETYDIARTPNVPEVYSIGIAYAKVRTTGDYSNWVYCGDIIRERTNSNTGPSNITGVPYIDKRNLLDASKDSFYVYYNDYDRNDWLVNDQHDPHHFDGKKACVARANKQSVLTNAARIFRDCKTIPPTTPTFDFRKLLATGSWDATNAVLSYGIPMDLFPFGNRPNPLPDLHSSAVWCAPLGRYLMTVSSGVQGLFLDYGTPPAESNGEIRLYSSVDGINWGNSIILDNFGLTDGVDFIEKPHSFFVSLDADASDDSHIVGKHFYIYWARTHTRTGGQELMRCEVNIIGPSFDNDNKSDLMIFNPSDNSIRVLTSTGSGFNGGYGSEWGVGYGGIKDNYFPADFNGDGITDLGYYDAPNNSFMVSISSGSPYFPMAIQWLSPTKTYDGALFGSFGEPAGKFYVGDFNGDGKADLMYFHPAGHSYWDNSIWVSTANATGTGLDGPGSGLWSGSNNFGSQKDNYFAADFNGDGKTDICYHETNNIFYVLLSSGTYFDWTVPGSGTWLNAGVLGAYDCSYYVGDFNGDGRADLLCVDQHNGYKISVSLSTGTCINGAGTGFNGPGSGQWYPSNSLFTYNKDNFFTADFNGDGKTDLGYFDLNTGFWVNLSAGSVFTSWVQWGGPGTIDYQYYVSNSLNKKATTYLVRSSAGPNGTISPAGVVTTNIGTARTFTITPSANCVINYVMVDGVNFGAITTYTFPGADTGTHSISAWFAPKLPISSATASSVYGGNVANNAKDGNMGTRWESTRTAPVDPQWIYVDLGSAKNICTVKLYWETANAKNYTLEGSNVSTFATKTVLATKTNMPTGTRTDNITGLSGSYRYIRMYGTARNTGYGYSIWEFEVYGN